MQGQERGGTTGAPGQTPEAAAKSAAALRAQAPTKAGSTLPATASPSRRAVTVEGRSPRMTCAAPAGGWKDRCRVLTDNIYVFDAFENAVTAPRSRRAVTEDGRSPKNDLRPSGMKDGIGTV